MDENFDSKNYNVNDKNCEVAATYNVTEYNANVVTPTDDRMLLINVSSNIYRGYYSVIKNKWFFEDDVPINENEIISFFNIPVPKFHG